MPVLEMERPARARPRTVSRAATHTNRRADTDGKVYCPICKVWYNPEPNAEIRERIEDAIAGRNVVGPFDTVDEMWASMMAGIEELEDE